MFFRLNLLQSAHSAIGGHSCYGSNTNRRQHMYLRSYFIGYLHHFRNRRARWQQPLRSGGGGFDSSLLLAFISVQRSMFLRWWLLVAAMATAAVQASTNSQVRLPYRLHTADVIGRTYERPVPPAPADTSLVGLDLNHTRSQRPANQWLVADGDRLFVVRTTYHVSVFVWLFCTHFPAVPTGGGGVLAVG